MWVVERVSSRVLLRPQDNSESARKVKDRNKAGPTAYTLDGLGDMKGNTFARASVQVDSERSNTESRSASRRIEFTPLSDDSPLSPPELALLLYAISEQLRLDPDGSKAFDELLRSAE